jgi:hypothetical protein
LVTIAVLAIFGAVSSPNKDTPSTVGMSVICGGVGYCLWKDGQRRLDSLKALSEKALAMNRENGFVDVRELSEFARVGEVGARSKLAKAQAKK